MFVDVSKNLPLPMKNICPYFACNLAVLLLLFTAANAQSVSGELSILKAPSSAITIDGDLKDWGDSLQYFNAECNARYALSNNKENLYFAIRIDDPSEATRILKSGITLGVDPKGKKKPSYAITFPLNTQLTGSSKLAQQDNFNEITQADRDELHREIITTLRGIKVEGFKDIEGDMITTSNTYGIKTAIDYDTKGDLVCEAAIPLKFFHLEDHSKTEWTFDIKINGVSNPIANRTSGDSNTSSMGGGGRGGMGGGGRGGMGGGAMGARGGRGGTGGGQSAANHNDSGILSKSVDFSGKFYLATSN